VQNKFVSIVVNFVDSLSHAGTDQRMVRELTNTTEAYLSITKSWFELSPLFDMLKAFAEQGAYLVIGTDHGSIQISNPLKVIGDKATTTNLRYKQGSAQDKYQLNLYFLVQRRFLRLSEQLQPLCEVLQKYLPARRNFASGNDNSCHNDEA
jgi:hypothetical protein